MAQTAPQDSLVADRYAVDFGRRAPGAGGGLDAFACVDRATGRSGLVAIVADRRLPPRPRALAELSASPVDGALPPLAHGAVVRPGAEGEAFAMVCPAPPGPPLAARLGSGAAPWGERELMHGFVAPVGAALDRLARRGLTHRAIRPDNVFQARPGEPVVLGPCWAAPPGCFQPAVFEPPYSAMCRPSGRGDGAVADDVYAAGVLLLALALGRVPLAGLDDAEVLARKLDLGGFEALAGGERLPPAVADLLRGMLAEDPEHRPSPLLLADPAAARVRRVAARPPRRAQAALDVAGRPVWTARAAAAELARQPDRAAELLRAGAVDRWLRRDLGDAALAARIEEAARRGAGEPDQALAGAMTAMRAVAALDPLAPLCWRSVVIFPDGLGPALAAGRDADADFAALIGAEAASAWAAQRPGRCDEAALRIDARDWRIAFAARTPGAGLARLRYALNPLAPCASPLLDGSWAVQLRDLLPALERASGTAARRELPAVDAEIAAFVVARTEQSGGRGWSWDERGGPGRRALAHLRLLARLQARSGPASLPGLAAWLARQAAPAVESWRSRPRRREIAERLAELARAGALAPMAALLDDPEARAADADGARRAADAVAAIDAALRGEAARAAERADAARRLGEEVAVGAGMLALGTTIALAMLG